MYCDVCGLPFCVDCTEYEDHNVRDVMTEYKKQKKNYQHHQLRNSVHFLLATIKHGFITCKNKMAPIISEIAEELQKVRDNLDAMSIDAYISRKGIKRALTEKLRNQISKMNKLLFKVKIHDISQHKSPHKPVQFLRSIKKFRFFFILRCRFRAVLHALTGDS